MGQSASLPVDSSFSTYSVVCIRPSPFEIMARVSIARCRCCVVSFALVPRYHFYFVISSLAKKRKCVKYSTFTALCKDLGTEHKTLFHTEMLSRDMLSRLFELK